MHDHASFQSCKSEVSGALTVELFYLKNQAKLCFILKEFKYNYHFPTDKHS